MRYYRPVRPLVSMLTLVLACVLCVAWGGSAAALQTVQNPQNGSVGIKGSVPSAPPGTAPTIVQPANGQTFTNLPITVSGFCTKGLLVKIFANNIFVGAVHCDSGSYSLQISLFSGRNDLVAKQFDAFDQSSPDSNTVTVNFNDQQFNPFGGSLLSLTSNYAERGANPGEKLTWPIILSGGTGPYAISVDWGDNKAPDLISTQFGGTIELSHTYDAAGIYRVIVKATDKNGLTAFLQLVGIANGAVTSSTSGGNGVQIQTIVKVLWLPAVICIPLIFISFWLGRRYELATLRKHLEQQREQ